MKSSQEADNEIKNILINNKIKDLKKFLEKRDCLNKSNQIMSYLFHTIQSAGILTTTIAAGYNMKELIWIGVGLNMLASLINVFEKTNDSISKKVLKDIYSIKNGTYVDEGMVIDIEANPREQKDKENDKEKENEQHETNKKENGKIENTIYTLTNPLLEK